MSDRQAVIVDYVRTPFVRAVEPTSGSGKVGKLAGVLPDDLLAVLIHALLERTDVAPQDVETVHVRHHDVQHDQRIFSGQPSFDALSAFGRAVDGETLSC